MDYRIARADDLEQIVAIYNSTVPSRMVTADTHPVTVESRQAWFEQHVPTRRPLWVVERAGRIDAWLSFSDFYGRPAYNGTSELSIYLAEHARGQGLGKALMIEALRVAPTLDVHTLLGFIFAHNLPSVGLFETMGFERWAHLPRVANLDGIERDLLILGKRVA